MNTETLKTFVTLSNLKNYTQTANKLFVAQSTVTNRIFELENELGKPLFIRNDKQLQLTEEGEHFFAYAKRILELENCAIDEIHNLNHFNNSIRIGSTNTIYDCHLANKIVDYFQENQDTKLTITIAHSNPLIEMLQDKIIDIAFTYIPYTKNQIECSAFSSDKLSLVTRAKNDEYKNGILQKDLAKIPYYYCDFTFQDLGSYIKDLFPAGHLFPLEIDRSANLLPFLLSANGYSFLPKSIVRSFLKSQSIIEVPLLDFTIPPIQCYMLHSPITSDTALSAFIQSIVANSCNL